jgi:predicted chitinase
VSRAEFEQIFPGHSGFYSYDGFVSATSFGSRREAAAFLANVYHETGGLTLTEEAPGRRSGYCDSSKSYGCPAGRDAYYGRGPIQLSWNYNYKAAGDALGLDLLNNPGLVARDPGAAWATAAWYWNNRVPHDATFGGTIDAINGAQECNGGNPTQVASRVSSYRRIADILGVSTGGNLSC